MPSEIITDKIRSFIIQQFPAARRRPIGVDDHLLQNGVIDSLGVLNLVGYLEKEFGVAVSDEDLLPENFASLGRMAAFVEAKRSITAGESV